jgi:hypothetical protein
MVVPAGTLDEDPGIRPMQSLFCDSQADWYIDVNSLPKYDRYPPKT